MNAPRAAAGLEVVDIATGRWHPRAADLIDAGARFLGLWTDAGGRVILATANDATTTLTRVAPAGGVVPSIVDVIPAAAWDEREAHDLAGVEFDGHSPLRALVSHPPARADWITPVAGDGVHEVAVGPIHAGVIESGHFRFHVVGEQILHLDLRLFYKHRGLERAAIGADPPAALRIAQRACAACAVTNTVTVAQAIEMAHGALPDDRLRRTRTLLLELERLYNHVNDIGVLCAGIGFAAGSMAFATLKERAQCINAELTGHRFLFGSIALGASTLAIDAAAARRLRTRVADIGADAERFWRELWANRSARARLVGAGLLRPADAARLGACGPAGRASGVADDARQASPGLWYPGFVPARAPDPSGDVAARAAIRLTEIAACVAIIGELLSDPITPGRTVAAHPGGHIGIGVVESPRGRTLAAVELGRGAVVRMHLRTGSYANWPSLATAATGAILPDFPLINKSFELCYACADR